MTVTQFISPPDCADRYLPHQEETDSMHYAVAAVLAAALLPAVAPAADVYRSVDAQGHVRYSDTPSPGAQLISVNTAPSDDSTAAAAATGSQASDADEQIARQRAQRTVEQAEAQKRSEECKQAQANYQRSMQARRLYQTGADGQRQYLSDAEADKIRTNQLLQMQDLCKGVQ
jgi:hypothetical protein